MSSISGSDEDSGTEEDSFKVEIGEVASMEMEQNSVVNERKFHKVFFKNAKGQLISVYRCLLHHKKVGNFDTLIDKTHLS